MYHEIHQLLKSLLDSECEPILCGACEIACWNIHADADPMLKTQASCDLSRQNKYIFTFTVSIGNKATSTLVPAIPPAMSAVKKLGVCRGSAAMVRSVLCF
jgi:hypothetical protein